MGTNSRLEVLEARIGAGLSWDPSLHPRGRDGRFINVGGWVRGLFHLVSDDGGGSEVVRAQVKKVERNPDNPHSSIVYAVTTTGDEVVSTSDKLSQAAPPKGTVTQDKAYLNKIAEIQPELESVIADLGGSDLSYDKVDVSKITLPKKGGPTPDAAKAEQLTTQLGGILNDEIERRVTERGGVLHTPESYASAEANINGQIADIKKLIGGTTSGAITYGEELGELIQKKSALEGSRRKYRDMYAEVAREVLKEVLGEENVGGDFNFNFQLDMGADNMTDAMNSIKEGVGSFMPKRWLDRTGSVSPKLTFRISQGKRAYYRPDNGKISAPHYKDDQVLNHEITHRMENTIPGLAFLEFAFYWRRVGVGTKAIPLKILMKNSGYGPSERARPDEFATPYIGKDYGGGPTSSWEILSIGIEHLMSRKHKKGSPGFAGTIGADKDFRAFVLGVLAFVRPSTKEEADAAALEGVSDVASEGVISV